MGLRRSCPSGVKTLGGAMSTAYFCDGRVTGGIFIGLDAQRDEGRHFPACYGLFGSEDLHDVELSNGASRHPDAYRCNQSHAENCGHICPGIHRFRAVNQALQ